MKVCMIIVFLLILITPSHAQQHACVNFIDSIAAKLDSAESEFRVLATKYLDTNYYKERVWSHSMFQYFGIPHSEQFKISVYSKNYSSIKEVGYYHKNQLIKVALSDKKGIAQYGEYLFCNRELIYRRGKSSAQPKQLYSNFIKLPNIFNN